MIVTGTNRGIVAVDADDGKLLWSNDWSAGNTANCPTPAYADGYVFWANGYGRGGICLKLRKEDDKVAADVAWTTHDMVCHHGGYMIHEGYIYGNNGGGWACLDLKTGEKKWQEKAVGKGSLVLRRRHAVSLQRERREGRAGHLLARGPGSQRQGQGQGQRPELGPSGGRRRTALPPLRHPPVLFRREAFALKNCAKRTKNAKIVVSFCTNGVEH